MDGDFTVRMLKYLITFIVVAEKSCGLRNRHVERSNERELKNGGSSLSNERS